jgi:nitroreductase
VDVRQAIEQRRSIKKFDPDHVMTAAERDELLRLTLLAPTAFNLQHCRLVVVADPDLRAELRRLSWNQSQVTDASLLVAVCADVNAWARQPERCWDHVPDDVRAAILGAVDGFYRDRPQAQRDEALRSCGLAAATLMLAAKGLGYDTCPMDGFDFDAVGRALNLPDDHLLSMFVAVGKPLQPAHPRGGRLPLDEVIIENRF